MRLVWIVMAALGAAGCKARDGASRTEAGAAGTVVAPLDAAPSDAGDAAPGDAGDAGGADAGTTGGGAWQLVHLETATVEAEARAFFDRWLTAQNRGDVAALAALYDVDTFRGVVRDGEPRRVDASTWLAAAAPGGTIAAEQLAVTTWREPGSTLAYGVVSLRFVERRRRGAAAAHGETLLQLFRDPAGAWSVVYEDRLTDQPGWSDAPPTGVAPVALTAPADDAAARALWRQLAPTGADHRAKLAAIPADPAITAPMARALLVEGNLQCSRTVETTSCGVTEAAIAPPAPDAGIDDPCLRRQLVGWAIAHLAPGDRAALQAALVALIALPPVERTLPALAFDAVPAGDDALRLALLAAAAEAGRDALADAQVTHLRAPAAVAEASALGIDAAVLRLDGKRQRGALLAALTDTRLRPATRQAVLAGFAGDRRRDVRAALAEVAVDGDCALAMAAASELAARGDASFLPRRPAGTDPAPYLDALCMLVHDRDHRRRDRTVERFLGPNATAQDLHYGDAGDGEDPHGFHARAMPERAWVPDLEMFFEQDGAPACRDGTCAVGRHGSNVTFYAHQDRLWIRELENRTFLRSACLAPTR
jgi:ketosteroid isomerase-like protein